MSNKDTIRSIAELALSEYPITKIATAIEEIGFYTWDRFGRYIHTSPTEINSILVEIRNNVLDELAKGYKGGEEDIEHFNQMIGPTILGMSGWTESKLPDFEKLQVEWNKHHIDIAVPPKQPEPAPQSKIWDVLAGLLRLKFGDKVIADLQSNHSVKSKIICDKLATVDVNVEPKTLKKYVEKI